MDQYTETTSQGWLSRLGDSIKGVLFGLILVVASCPVHYLNEGRAVKTAKALEEGAGAVVSVSADAVEAANEGKLVHMTGDAKASDLLADATFGVKGEGIKLRRTVEMYQWKESSSSKKEKKLGGKQETKTTYKYSKDWSSSVINSGGFKVPAGHENPGAMPFMGESWKASKVALGAFQLGPGLIGQIGGGKDLPPNPEAAASLPPPYKSKAKIQGSSLLIGAGAGAGSPEVGDLRLRWTLTPGGVVSVVAAQTGPMLGPYKTKVGRELEMLTMGPASAAAMFEAGEKANVMLTWILRLVGFLCMVIGFSLIFKPLSVAADVVPFIGDMVGMGTGFAAFAISIPATLVLIAIAWMAARPLLGGALLVGGIGLAVGFKVMARRSAA